MVLVKETSRLSLGAAHIVVFTSFLLYFLIPSCWTFQYFLVVLFTFNMRQERNTYTVEMT